MSHIVALPYLDIRRKRNRRKIKVRKDIFQETEALMGDRVHVLGIKEPWAYVEVVSQEKKVGESWEGMRGWVPLESLIELDEEPKTQLIVTELKATVYDTEGKELLSIGYGTKLTVIDEGDSYILVQLANGVKGNIEKGQVSLFPREKFNGSALMHEAKKFLDKPYFWGGCSSFESEKGIDYGIDCSGLTYLVHRAFGKEIPRNAVDQYRKANPVDTLEEGDLIFYSTKDEPEKVIHVMFYAGNGIILEATECARKVREIPFNELFDAELENTKHGDSVIRQDIEQKRILYYGSFFR